MQKNQNTNQSNQNDQNQNSVKESENEKAFENKNLQSQIVVNDKLYQKSDNESTINQISFIQSSIDKSQHQQLQNQDLKSKVTLNKDDFLNFSKQTHSQSARNHQPEENKVRWNSGTLDLNKYNPQQDKRETLQQVLNQIEEEREQTELNNLLYKGVKMAKNAQIQKEIIMDNYKELKNKKEIGDHARHKALKTSSCESSSSLEENYNSHAISNQIIYQKIQNKIIQDKKSVPQQNQLKLNVPIQQLNNLIKQTDQDKYNKKVKAMKAKDHEQSMGIFSDSDHSQEQYYCHIQADQYEFDRKQNDIDEADHADEDFNQEMQKIDQDKILTSLYSNQNNSKSQQKKQIETDSSKWKDSGFDESEISQLKQEYIKKNQIEPLFEKSQNAQIKGINLKQNIDNKEKKIMSLDGKVVEEQKYIQIVKNPEANRKLTYDNLIMKGSVNHSIEYKSSLQKQKDSNNKIISQSKFFILKKAQTLPCHISQNPDRQQQFHQNVNIESNENDIQQEYFTQKNGKRTQKKSQNLSQFGQNHQQQKNAGQEAIPMVKQWFEQLSVSERVQCITTIDMNITKSIMQMHSSLTKTSNNETGKFKMRSQFSQSFSCSVIERGKQHSDQQQNLQPKWIMQQCNSQSYKSSPEVQSAELKLIKFVRLTDTFQMHDTLAVSEDLLENTQLFYQLAQEIVGTNYLVTPHQISWLDEDYQFESYAPMWIDMQGPNSLAYWILYFFERALFIQYKNNVYDYFSNIKDQKNFPIFTVPDRKLIVFKDEMRSFWRTFCDECKQQNQFDHQISIQEINTISNENDEKSDQFYQFIILFINKSIKLFCPQALQDKSIKPSQNQKSIINKFNGGISINNLENQIHQQEDLTDSNFILDKIQRFSQKLKLYIKNNDLKTPDQKLVLNLQEVCMNTLQECSSMMEDMDPIKLARSYQFQNSIQKSPDTISASQQGNSDDDCVIKELQVINKKMEIYLQRIFAESFKEIVEIKLKAGCVSENRKLLKKKLKKKIAQEKQKELDREIQEKKKKEEQEQKLKKDKQKNNQAKAKEENNKITLNTKNAIDLLMQNDTKIEKIDQTNTRNVDSLKNVFQELKDKKQQETVLKKKKNKKGKNIQKQEIEKKIESFQNIIKPEQIKESWNESEKIEEILKFKLIEEENKIKSNSKNENQTQKLFQSHNYFKFFDPKIHDLSSKQQEQQSNEILVNHSEQDPMNLSEIKLDFTSSEVNLATKKVVQPKNHFQNSISGTIKTDCSTREQSKKTIVQEDEQQIQEYKYSASIQAMSNQEIIDVYQKSIQVKKEQNGKSLIIIQEGKRKEGNHAIKTQEHQRNQVDNKYHQDIRSIVNELVSEETCFNQIKDKNENNIIQIQVKDSKMHVHKDYLENFSQNSQEIKKEKSKDKRKKSSSSDGKSEVSSDQDYLPDVYQKFDPQPHDNDSSDFGADGEIESESIIEDNYSSYIDSATASNKDKKWVQKNRHRQLSSKINQNLQKISDTNLLPQQSNEITNEMKTQSNSQNQKEAVSALITQKSIKSAHPKIENKQIEVQTNNKQVITDSELNPPPQQEQQIIQQTVNVQQQINEYKKQKNKKTKKQKKEAFIENQKKNNEAKEKVTPEIKQFEIIKPEIQKPVKQKADVKKQNEQAAKKKNKVEESKVVVQNPLIQQDKLNHGKEGNEQKQQQQNKKELQIQQKPLQTINDQKKKNVDLNESGKINQQNNEHKIVSKTNQEIQTKQNENQKSLQKKNDDQKSLNLYYYEDRQSKFIQKPQQTQDFQKGLENKKQIYQQKAKKNIQEEEINKKQSQEEQKIGEARSELDFGKFLKQSDTNDQTKQKQINKSNQNSNSKINSNQMQNLEKSTQQKQNSKKLFENTFQDKDQTFEKAQPNNQVSKQKESEQNKVNNAQQNANQIKSSSVSTKKKSSRKKKKNKNNIQNSWIDPNTGQTVFMDNGSAIYNQFTPYNQNYQQSPALLLTQQLQKLSQQMQQTGNANMFAPNQMGMQGAVINPISGQIQQNQDLQMRSQSQFQPMSISQQVQEILYKLNERILIQQHQQAEEIQKKQQIEQENQLQEECEPCPEINSQRYEQFFEFLEEEMKNKVKQIDQLKDSVRKERQGFISMVEQKVKETFSNKFGNGYVGIKIFGSMATELAIETSDVDLVVTGIKFIANQNQSNTSQFKDLNKDNVLKIMHQLYDCLESLKQKGQIYKMKFIQGANVPIIKLVADLQIISQIQAEKQIAEIKEQLEEEHGEGKIEQQIYDKKMQQLKANIIDHKMRYLKIDISIDEQSDNPLPKYDQIGKSYSQVPQFSRSHSGIETIYHIQELVKKRKDLRPIVMIIKKIFDETYLSMPYYGGISSYSLVLMVSAYLNRYDEDKDQSLSRNLSGFFHFYGAGFKPNLYYLKGDSIEFCEDQSQRPSSDPFIVLDPLDLSNNISHSTFRFKDIQRALVQAFKIINESCKKFQLSSSQNEQKNKKRNEELEIYHPKKVINRLLEEIKEEYRQYTSSYDDI